MPWIAALKKPKIATIAILALAFAAYYGYSELQQARLETRVSELEGEVTRKSSQISSLKGAVAMQNEAVERWQAKADSRAQEAREAMREARSAKQAADEAVGRIQSSDAMTCQDGVDLIDRELFQ